MALFQSKQIAAGYPVPNATDAVDSVPVTAEFAVPAGLALNDVIEMGGIPEGCIVTDAIVAFEDLDTGGSPAIKFDMGILSGDYGSKGARTCGNEFLAADTTAQTGGVARLNKTDALFLATSNATQSWGFKVNTAAATLAVGKRIRATVWVRPAPVAIS